MPEAIRDIHSGKTWNIESDGSGRVINRTPLDVRFDPDDNTPVYIGLNYGSYDAGTADSTWVVMKISYSGSNTTRVQKKENVTWHDRSILF